MWSTLARTSILCLVSLAPHGVFGSPVQGSTAPAPPSNSTATHNKRGISGPVIASNFPDPSFIEVNGHFYAFSTNSGGKHVPVAQSSDFAAWSLMNVDALPKVGAWSNGQNVWAPDVIRRVRLLSPITTNPPASR